MDIRQGHFMTGDSRAAMNFRKKFRGGEFGESGVPNNPIDGDLHYDGDLVYRFDVGLNVWTSLHPTDVFEVFLDNANGVYLSSDLSGAGLVDSATIGLELGYDAVVGRVVMRRDVTTDNVVLRVRDDGANTAVAYVWLSSGAKLTDIYTPASLVTYASGSIVSVFSTGGTSTKAAVRVEMHRKLV